MYDSVMRSHAYINGVSINAYHVARGDLKTGKVIIDVSPIPDDIGRIVIFTFIQQSGVCVVVAREADGALNLMSLTGGNFKRILNVTFSSGETLYNEMYVTKIDSNILQESMTYGGSLPPVLPETHFKGLPFSYPVIQENDTTISYEVTQKYRLGNQTIIGKGTVKIINDCIKKLPLNQSLTGSNIQVNYDANSKVVHYELISQMKPRRRQ